ncbi:MAG: cereblon family protein [Thermodesulfobacteriota bacterium]
MFSWSPSARIGPEDHVLPWHLLRPASEIVPVQHEEARPGRPHPGEGPQLLCAACGQPVTTPEAAIAVAGGHVHTFFNPAGFAFTIGCFDAAPGASAAGLPTLEHTWFPGCAWSYVLCCRCHAHLGWLFQGRGLRFFGLVLDRLRARP